MLRGGSASKKLQARKQEAEKKMEELEWEIEDVAEEDDSIDEVNNANAVPMPFTTTHWIQLVRQA